MKANNAAGWGTTWSTTKSVVVSLDSTPPTPPTAPCNAWDTPSKGITLSDKNGVWQSTTAAPYFEWSGATDNIGVAGYAVYYGNTDTDPGTTATQAGATYDATPKPGAAGTYYLNVRTIDGAGNYSAKTTLFTVKYDGSAPNNPTTCNAWDTSPTGTSMSDKNDVWQTITANPYFQWNIPTDVGASGLAGYYYYFGASAGGEPAILTTDNFYDAGTDPGTPGVYYLRVKTKDNLGNTSAATTLFTVKYGGIPSISGLAARTDSAGAAITAGTWQTDNSPYFYWTTGSDFTVDGYSWAWDATPNDTLDAPPGTNAYYQAPDNGLANGQHIFYITAKNQVGWSSVAQFAIWADTTVPNIPATCNAWDTSSKAINITDKNNVWQSTTAAPYFEWTAPADIGGSGLAGYYYYYGASASGDPAEWTTANSFDAGADPGISGIYYLRVKTKDNAGNISVSSTVFTVKYDGPPVITDLTSKTDSGGAAITAGTWQTDNSPYFYWTEPVSASAIEGYSWGWDAQPDTVLDNPPGTSVFYQSPDNTLSNGQHTFYIKSKNGMGWGAAAQFAVWVDTIAPANPATCSSWKTSAKTTVISSGVWQTETANPYFEWDIPADPGGSGIAGYYYYFGPSAGGAPATWTASNSYDAGTDPGAAGIYYLRVKTKDNAGNESPPAALSVIQYDTLPAITDLAARTGSAGTAITQSAWQADNSPYFYWTAPASYSAIEGYSWAWDAQPDTTAETPPGTNAYYQAPDGALSNGQHVFYIKARNLMGWGSVTSFSIWVNVSAPALFWTGETNYTIDGLNPETGDRATSYVYRVKYTDADNDAPASGYPRLYVLKAGTTIQTLSMNYVSGTNSAGAIYSTATVLSALGADYTYHFAAYDVWTATATGAPVGLVDAPDVTNNAPTLGWTGETNYTADGLNPETGDRAAGYVYRVKYTDADGDAPGSGYPKVHIKKGGAAITGSPFDMTYVSGANNTGAIYTYSRTLDTLGTDYTYYFGAQDVNGAQAIGAPASAVDAPDVTNNSPALGWTGETNYTADGLDPETGDRATSYVYRVKYTDVDNDAPGSGYPKVHIKKGGTGIFGSPFTMTFVSGANSTGAVYVYSKVLTSTGTDYTYYFEAQDVYGAQAAGAPAIPSVDAPDVVNNAPILGWTGEINYAADGLDPQTGDVLVNFTYRVKFTDSDGDAPAAGYPKVHIKKGGAETTGSPFVMTYVSGANDTGAIYTHSTTLALGADYTYYSEARDINGSQAIGAPTSAVDAPDVGEISKQGDNKTTVGDNLFRPRSGGTSKVKFAVPASGKVSLKIYNTSLKLVRTLYEGDSIPGNFQRDWDGRDDRGHYVAPDIYFLHYVYPGGKEVRKIGVKK